MKLRTLLCSAAALVGLAVPLSASAGFDKTNPVTGETETYTWKFVGTDTWNGTGYWQDSDGENPSGVPGKSGDNTWDPILFDGDTININAGMSVEGWNLRLGLYNGARVRLNNFVKWQGNTTMWVTVDDTSKFTVGAFGKGNIAGGQAIKCSTTRENGIEWLVNLESTGNVNNIFEYYLAGAGSVSYQGITAADHKIKQADVSLSGDEKSVQSKKLVSFTSTTKTFTADAAIKVKNGDDVLETVYLVSVTQGETTLTDEDNVGACELVQASDGVYLYWVDGDPDDVVIVEKTYKPSININFTTGTSLSTPADVGISEYAIPGTSWNNLIGNNGSLTTVNGVDSTGAASAISGGKVTISGTRGYWRYNDNSGATTLYNGYIDDRNNGSDTPTVVVEGIPYYSYKLVVYFSNDTDGVNFGYITVNGDNYKGSDGATVTCEGASTDKWGSANHAAWTEGGNYLVTPTILNEDGTLTLISHDLAGCRAGVAAIQIVEVKPESGDDDLVIEVSGETTYTVSEAAELTGTVYITGSGTLTLAGEAKLSAATIYVAPEVTLNVNADRLDGTTFTGAGTVVYDGVVPPTGKGWTNPDWTGTVWFKNQTISQFEGNQYGNDGSTIRFTGVTGFLQSTTYENRGYVHAVPLELVDEGETVAFTYNNGWSGFLVKINTLKGTGTLKTQDSGLGEHIYIVDGNDFTGAFNLTGKYVYVGGSQPENTPAANPNGKLEIRAGATLTVPAGKTWTANGGFVVDGALVVNGALASSAATAVSGSGTVTFGGVPSPTGDAWWTNSAWTGTVEIKGVTALNGDYLFNNYGNAASTVKLTNCSGWLKPNYTCVPALEIGGTFTWNDGSSGLNNTFKVATLKGSGTISIPNSGAATAVWQITDDWSGFTGAVVGNNNAAKRVLVFGATLPDTIAAGDIYVSEGATLDLSNSSSAWWGVGMRFVVDGTVKATSRSQWGGGTAMTLGDTGVLELATFSGYVNDINNSYANVTGTGTVRYTGDSWRSLPNGDKMFATTLSIELENEAGVVFHGGTENGSTGTIGSIFGTKNLRNDLGGYDKVLTVKQAEDGVWSGSFLGGDDRLDTFIVDPGDTTTGTLTLAGTHTHDNNMTVNGSVNITGTWVGATTVNGTIGGTGTLTGDLTFGDGAIFKAFATDADGLAVSGTITYPDEGTVAVQVSSTFEGEAVLVTAEGLDVSKFALAAGAPSSATLSVEENTLKVTAPVTVAMLVNTAEAQMLNYESVAGAVTALGEKSGNWAMYVQKGENAIDALSVPAGLNLTVIENGGTLSVTTATVAGALIVRGGTFGTINVAGSVTVWAASTSTSVVITSADFARCRVYDDAAENVTVTTTVGGKIAEGEAREESQTYTDWVLADSSSTTITVDVNGCDFTVDAATATAITEATGVASDSENFGNAAIAYVVGGTLDENGDVVIPTPTITVNGTAVTVTFTSDDAKFDAYAITVKLQYATDITSTMTDVENGSGVMGSTSVELSDTSSDAARFYQVVVTVADKTVGE